MAAAVALPVAGAVRWVELWTAANMAAPNPCPDYAAWLAELAAALATEGEAQAAAVADVAAFARCSPPVGTSGIYAPDGEPSAVMVTTTGDATTYRHRHGPGTWEAIPVRFWPLGGHGVVDVAHVLFIPPAA